MPDNPALARAQHDCGQGVLEAGQGSPAAGSEVPATQDVAATEQAVRWMKRGRWCVVFSASICLTFLLLSARMLMQ